MGARGSQRIHRGWYVGAGALLMALLAGGCEPGPPSVDPFPVGPGDPPLNLQPKPANLDDPCDGWDNNGDGEVDEECYCYAGEVQDCYPAAEPEGGLKGACVQGRQRCVDISVDFQIGVWGSCESAVLPQAEICGNDIDEDCNGVPERCEVIPDPDCVPGAVESCYTGPDGTENIGICHSGVRSCGDDETWGGCEGSILPKSEICGNAVDEDCSGEDLACEEPPCASGHVRICYDGPANTLGVGVCSAGTQTCNNEGKWLACEGSTVPSPEICGNGVDENCDGTSDGCD